MTTYNAPHEARDTEKLNAIVEAIRTNQDITPIVVDGENAICGSHRIAAFEKAWKLWDAGTEGWENTNEPTVPTVELMQSDIDAAIESVGGETWADLGEYNDICEAVYNTTEDAEVKAALKDQVI